MATCPNCGEIVMEGDPYCSNCGTIFSWDDDEESSDDYGNYDYEESEPDDYDFYDY